MKEKYEFVHLIGEGSFGKVFKGYDKATPDKNLAIKLVNKSRQNLSENDIRAMRRESEIQKNLSHPNIVKVINAYETINELVLITEFVSGGNLAVLMSRYADGLKSEEVKKLSIDLLCALHYLHSQRVLHRDLKPQNVLMDESNSAKLADFGFARNLTMNTMVCTSIKGTPLYMAPELIEEKPYDHKAELWSLGAILYEATYGTTPFATNSILTLVNKVRNECITYPCQKPNLEFLQGLLEKDCKKRQDWDTIISHEYIKSDARIQELAKTKVEFTKNLTESQEIRKEIQRHEKAKNSKGSQTLINIAKDYEARQKKLEKMKISSGPTPMEFHQPTRRNSEFAMPTQPIAIIKPEPIRRNSAAATLTTQENFNNEEWLHYLDTQKDFNVNDLALIVKPLTVKNSSKEVILKTIAILSLPLKNSNNKNIHEIFSNAKIFEIVQEKIRYFPEKNLLQFLARLFYENSIYLAKIDISLISILLLNENLEKYALDILLKLSHSRKLTDFDTENIYRIIHKYPEICILLLSKINKPELQKYLQSHPIEKSSDKLELLIEKIVSF